MGKKRERAKAYTRLRQEGNIRKAHTQKEVYQDACDIELQSTRESDGAENNGGSSEQRSVQEGECLASVQGKLKRARDSSHVPYLVVQVRWSPSPRSKRSS